jgi:RHS repeat-associated protein
MSIYNNILSRISRKLLVALMLCIPFASIANVEEPTEKSFKGAEITNGIPATAAPLVAADNIFIQGAGAVPWNAQIAYGVQNIVQFEIDFKNQANKYFHNLNFSANCTVDIKCYSDPNNPNTVSQTYTGVVLQVNYNAALGATYKAIATYKFNGYYKVEVKVVSLTTPGLSSPTDYPIFELKNKLIVNRQYNFVDVTTNPTSYTNSLDKLKIAWALTNYKGAESVDLEWTYLDAESTFGIYLNSLSASTITVPIFASLEAQFRNNSSRVNLSGSEYTFNLNYNKGFLLFRLRGVQYRNGDGMRIEGNWNYNASPVLPSPTTAETPENHQFYQGITRVKWHQENLNWQYNASYAEEGKKKEVISYFDGSLRSRQTVTINNADNKSIVAEPVYDVMGRSAMSILPTPTNENVLKYFKSFNLSNRVGTPPVSYKDILPTAPCVINASMLSTTSGVEQYYSANNPFIGDPSKPWNKAIPKSEGFPFAVTRFKEDNTGRVAAQGGVGQAFQLGSKHETKYFYGKPSQYELDRIFGAEVGDMTHYLKNMVVDANKQVSVSYQNSEGKTIATALAGLAPENTEALTTATAPTNTVHDVLLTPSSFQINSAKSSLEASSTFLVSSTGNYKFTYKFLPEQYKEVFSGGTLCYNCSYDLLITIKSECGATELKRIEIKKITPFNTICIIPTEKTGTFDLVLSDVGEYGAYFELSVNKENLNKYTNDYLVRNTDIKTFNYFLLQQLIEEDLSQCYSDCEACESLPATVTEFVVKIKAYYTAEGLSFGPAEITYAQNLYADIIRNCGVISATCLPSPCDEILDILKQDVMPGGQYAEYDNEFNLEDQQINVLQYYQDPSVFYYEDDGVTLAKVEDANGVLVYPNTLPLKEFIQKFEDSWASSLVKYHPEYCYYTWCLMNDKSQAYNQKLEELNDPRDAIALGLFDRTDPLKLLTSDPFFYALNGSPAGNGAPYASQMQADLLNFSSAVMNVPNQPVKNIFKTIDYILYCGETTPPVDWALCTKPLNDQCRSDFKEWLLYKEWYLERKLKYYTMAMKNSSDPKVRDCSNCRIPGSGAIDPGSWTNCIAPAVTNFTLSAVANSTADGFKRLLLKYKNGDDVTTWPLQVEIQMTDNVNNVTTTQIVLFTPGFGSQEITVQDNFNVFSINTVVCAGIIQDGRSAVNGGKASNKISRVNGGQASKIGGVNNLLSNATNNNIAINAAKSNVQINNLSNKNDGTLLKGWNCPVETDFSWQVLPAAQGYKLEVCYNGPQIPTGMIVKVIGNVLFDGYPTQTEVEFCANSTCKIAAPYIAATTFGGANAGFAFTSIICEVGICGQNESCLPESQYTIDYITGEVCNPNNIGFNIELKGSSLYGSPIYMATMSAIPCFVFPQWNLSNPFAVITKVRTFDCETAWECPTESNFTFTVTQSPIYSNGYVDICYTGVPIPAGKTVILKVRAESNCGISIIEYKFCSNTPTCQQFVLPDRSPCVYSPFTVESVYCTDEPCAEWVCPEGKENFTVQYFRLSTANWQVNTCYIGPPIPAGKKIKITVSGVRECGGAFNYDVYFCSNTALCNTRIIQQELCDGTDAESFNAYITKVECVDEPCVWECPTSPSLYTITATPPTLLPGLTELKVCYNGPAIPVGKKVVVHFQVVTDNCGTYSEVFEFCSTSDACIKVLRDFKDCKNFEFVIESIECTDEPCAEWVCPTGEENYSVQYNQLPNGDWQINTCYLGPPIPIGKKVLVTISGITDCNNEILYTISFCSNTPLCHTRIYPIQPCGGANTVFEARITNIECVNEPCEWECPVEPSNYTITVTNNNGISLDVKTCYVGVPIPVGKKVIVEVIVRTKCGEEIIYNVTFCSNTPLCNTRSFNLKTVCDAVEVRIGKISCIDEPCEWECPVDPSNYTITVTDNGQGFNIKTCYTGAPIPAGKKVIVRINVNTNGCFVEPYDVTFCSNTALCNTKYFSYNDLCSKETPTVTLGDVRCLDEKCEWECPVDPSNYIITVTNNNGISLDVKTCYVGAPIPVGKKVIVEVIVRTKCGEEIIYNVTYCSNTLLCNTRSFNLKTVCDAVEVRIGKISCIDEPCEWECPVDQSNYTFTITDNGQGFNIKTCYTGAPIPVGKKVIVRINVNTTNCFVEPYDIIFCSNTALCNIKFYTYQQLCSEIPPKASILNVECADQPCEWVCPTDPSNYTITVTSSTSNPDDKNIKVCYIGAPIPAGKIVVVNVAIQLDPNCGRTVYESFVFCGSGPTCININRNYKDCKILSTTVSSVDCKDSECPSSWPCPTSPSYYAITTSPIIGSPLTRVKVCYSGPAIPAGKSVNVPVIINTSCGVKNEMVTFCSSSATCLSFTKNYLGCTITSTAVGAIYCENKKCTWLCPTTPENYSLQKNLLSNGDWQFITCYTGPAIPSGKKVRVQIAIANNGCRTKSYFVTFCANTSLCNAYVIPANKVCGTFLTATTSVVNVVCTDEPCTPEIVPCVSASEFTVANIGTCTSVGSYNSANLLVSHIGGPVLLNNPYRRVKVKLKITLLKIGTTIETTKEKSVWFADTESSKTLCFVSSPSRVVTRVEAIETECSTISCPSGDCCNDPLYGLYDGKVRRYQDYVEPPDFNTVMTGYYNSALNFTAYPILTCKSQCETMADGWIQDLKNCVSTTDPFKFIKLERVRRKLIDVCKQSCTAQQGSVSITPYSDLNPLPSFESIIAAEFGANTATCSYDLLSDPYPWGKNPILDNTYALETNTKICATLLKYRNEAVKPTYAISNTDIDGVHRYLKDYYSPYYTLEKSELQELVKACELCNGIMKLPVELPLFMDAEAKPCLDCAQYAQLAQQFAAKYPGLPTTHPKYDILFKNFANHKTGFSYAYEGYAIFAEKCQTLAGFATTGRLCEKPLLTTQEVDNTTQCLDEKFYNALSSATTIYTAYIEEIKRVFRNKYTAKCLSALASLETDAKLYEYHYTLYYYDQSSNLVKTIPPQGVDMLTTDQINALQANRVNSTIVPFHTLATTYEYNSFNQVVKQSTPDAGVSEFWYDRLGRLVVSQNAEQKAPLATGAVANRYSYTKYEPLLGRIIEVGEKTASASITTINTKDQTALDLWLASGTDKQITETIYDKADLTKVSNPAITNEQQNYTSRKRVVSTLFKKVRGTTPSIYDAGTHYSYDINGNAKVVWQENARLKEADATTQGLKRMDYDFDLVSGKVNKVYYQKGKGDQYIYEYGYDPENRVIAVRTSRDGLLWQKDANYNYYLHGPLARTELGTNKVQGIDYVYTLQGWMKFINAPALNPIGDIGSDGNSVATSTFSRDAMGYGISYYNGDYKPIQPNSSLQITETMPAGPTGKDLFNGNIRATTLQIAQLGTGKTYSYSYDQLNRIVKMRKHESVYTPVVGTTSASLSIPPANTEYQEDVTYDANGNILTYLRNGNGTTAAQAMDNFTYQYEKNPTVGPNFGKVKSNKLRYVHDQVAATAYGDDIDNQTTLSLATVQGEKLRSQPTDNYQYDNIGNLIKDKAEKIETIEWTVYGKISKITKTDAAATTIEYEYDATGNRIYKKVTAGGVVTNTFYTRDASGNTMALYSKAGALTTTNTTAVKWNEQHLYGSSRLGIANLNISPILPTAPIPAPNAVLADGFDYGKTVYELSNHLGNVLVTLTDKKGAIQNGTTGNVNYYSADIATANDYYPFGMNMTGRKYTATSSTGYRYGFNGKERSSEIASDDYDFGARMYDARLGRWLSVDRGSDSYPSITPFAFAINSPLIFVDPNGQWVAKVITSADGKTKSLSFVAEENDNLATLAIQLGIPAESLKKLDPKLEENLKDIKSGFEIGLESLKVVERINKVLNLSDKDLIKYNCASLAEECSKGLDVPDQYNSKGEAYTKHESLCATCPSYEVGVNNVPEMVEQLKGLKANGIEGAQIGSVIIYTPVLEPAKLKKSVEYLVSVDRQTFKQGLEDKKKTTLEITKAMDEYDAKEAKSQEIYKKWEGLLIDGEKHFSVLILKDKTGTNVNGIIHKQGKGTFSKEVESESNATDGSIFYMRDSVGEDKSKSFYIHRNANNK